MVNCALNLRKSSSSEGDLPRVSAVSYLNTLPLVWGFLHGPQQGAVELSFSVPAVCADKLASGDADFGIVPCAELPRLNAVPLRDVGIACRGPVRSILLVSKVPPASIRKLAADSSSRTSVRLTRIVLEQKYGCRPEVTRAAPDLDRMLADADAALIIGDPALRLDPSTLPYRSLDLGQEWVEMTDLPDPIVSGVDDIEVAVLIDGQTARKIQTGGASCPGGLGQRGLKIQLADDQIRFGPVGE